MKTYMIFVLALALLPCLALSAVVEEGVEYNGWKCVVMKNESTEVYLAPDLNGRVIQYKVDGHEWLWVNRDLAGKVFGPEENYDMDHWKNYGGDKVWPAPQGWDGTADFWPGPGDRVITRPHTCEVLKAEGKEVKVRMTGSDADKGGHAGVQFIREVVLRDGSNRVEFKTSMKNVSDREASWGIWAVTQMEWSDRGKKKGERDWNEEAFLAVPMNPKSRWPEKYQVMFGLASSFNWQPDYRRNLLIVRYMNFVGKIVMDVSDGWAAMVDPASGYTYVQRFPYDPKAAYPDGGNFESWVAGKGEFVHNNKRLNAADDPKGRLIEMEILGPRVTLKPGQQTSIQSSWEVYKGGLDAIPEMKK
jgi:hypothetical protein